MKNLIITIIIIGEIGNKRTSGDHPDYSNIKIGQNTENSAGDLRRLAVTQTRERLPTKVDVKNYHEFINMIIIIMNFDIEKQNKSNIGTCG